MLRFILTDMNAALNHRHPYFRVIDDYITTNLTLKKGPISFKFFLVLHFFDCLNGLFSLFYFWKVERNDANLDFNRERDAESIWLSWAFTALDEAADSPKGYAL